MDVKQIAADNKSIRRIERRFHDAQKIADSDVRWLIERAKRMSVADQVLIDQGFEVNEQWMAFQPPLTASG
jgi:hypothetical protein